MGHCAFHRKDFAAFLRRVRKPANKSFFVCRVSDGKLVGVINISQIFLGFFRSAYMGYYVFKPYARGKYMTKGLSLALEEAFGGLGLHRVEANIRPENIASRKLVQRLGFRMEGYSPRYLMVDGKWRDHERWAITIEDWDKGSGKGRKNGSGNGRREKSRG